MFGSTDVRVRQENMSNDIKTSKTKPSQMPWKPQALTCPHILPMSGNKVIGAPMINTDIGQVVYSPKNTKEKFIRYIWNSLNQ